MRATTSGALAILCTLTLAGVASAQPRDSGRFELSGGIRWMGPIEFAEVPANETTNGGGTSALFRSQTAVEGSLGGTATFGLRLSRVFLAEVAAAYNPTTLTTRITSDLEAPNTTVDAPLTQFLIEGGLVAHPPRWSAGRVSPFVTAGIGYVRQLNDGRTLVDTGSAYYVGGGIYYQRLANRPRRLKATGVRADVRATVLRDGVAPDQTGHLAPTLNVTVFARF